jgi:glycosyltransferase involved in cell wall biosynthesis
VATAATLEARHDIRQVRRLHKRIAQSAAAVVVCSDLDRRRLQAVNAVVIPNAYPDDPIPRGRAEVGDPPVLMFAGLLTYHANADAVEYLVERILPQLRRVLPSVRLRLVGAADDAQRRLHDPPGVTVTGYVPDITTELAQADAIVVPIRYGGGTRIKILEAFAHRIPVVSTTVGAEGIGAVHEQEILLADTPADFAAACVRVLRDAALRRRMIEAAHRLFARKYRSDRVQEMVASLAARIASGSTVQRRAVDRESVG